MRIICSLLTDSRILLEIYWSLQATKDTNWRSDDTKTETLEKHHNNEDAGTSLRITLHNDNQTSYSEYFESKFSY